MNLTDFRSRLPSAGRSGCWAFQGIGIVEGLKRPGTSTWIGWNTLKVLTKPFMDWRRRGLQW
jgi:hypothetical protein